MEVLALLVIILIVANLQIMLFCDWVFNKLDYTCQFSVSEAHEGDEIFLVETVHNRKILPVPWLKVNINTSKWLDFAETLSVVAQESRCVTSNFLLKSYQKTIRRWKVKCSKRGVFTTENVTFIGGDLFNLSNVSFPVRVDAKVVVYPEVLNLEEMFVPANYLQGDNIVRRWIVDDPFIVAGAREYTSGDSMNRIHWRATAKEGRLMVRKNDFTSRLSLTVILNIQSIEFEYKDVVDKEMMELGIKAAATFLDKALKTGSPVRLASNSCTVDKKDEMIFTDEASGRNHIGELLKILAQLQLMNLMDFDNFLPEIAEGIQGSDIIIITCYINEQICSTARALKLKGNSVKLLILDPLVNVSDLPGDLDCYILAGGD